MVTLDNLLHRRHVLDVPVLGKAMAARLAAHVARVDEEARRDGSDPSVTVVIRTLNEAIQLAGLLADLRAQAFDGDVEIVVVDNESTDATRDVAWAHAATIVDVPRGSFTYPRSMNLGMQAATHDVVLLTVGHARLSNAYALRGGARHFRRADTGGVFGSTLPNRNATLTERWVATTSFAHLRRAREVKRAGLGVLAATNAMVSKRLWHRLGRFDERYERGGEDTHLARRMLDSGLRVVDEPALAVHHSHGLGPVNFVREWRQWMRTLKEPQRLDMDALARRRPDLVFDERRRR